MATAKIQTVKGFRVEIFSRLCEKILLGLDGLDRQNGHRMGIVCGGKMCYTWVNKLSDKSKFKMEMTAMEDMRNIRIMIEEFGHKHPEIKLEKSPISDCDITELEVNLGITIPNTVKDYFRSYTLSTPFVAGRMLGDFSKTYCEETSRWRELEIEEEIATQILHLPLMFPDFDLGEFENINRVFAGTGYLWLGTYNDDYYVLIEMQSGQIYQVDMGQIRLTTKDETRVDILKWALPFFHSFEDLVRCFFADELYDEEEMIFVAE